jgi:two-component system, sensor histidine kinase LadS
MMTTTQLINRICYVNRGCVLFVRSIIALIIALNPLFFLLRAEGVSDVPGIMTLLSLQYYEDTTSKRSISEIYDTSMEVSGKWKSSPAHQTLNFGISHSAFWIRCLFQKQKNDTGQYYMLIKSSVIDYLDIYNGTGNSFKLYQLGDRRAFSNRPVHYRQFVVPIKRDSQQDLLPVYIRVASYDGIHESIPIQILSEDELKHLQTFDAFLNGLLFGLFIFMIILSIALISIIKDTSQILFVAYVIFYCLWSLVFKGFADMFLWPDLPISNTFLMLSALLVGTFMVWFSVVFLTLNKINAMLERIIKILLIIMTAISTVLILSNNYTLFFLVFMTLISILIVLIIITTVLCLLHKTTESYFYASSWFLNFFGAILYIGKVFGFLPSTYLTEKTFQIGIVFQASVLSIGIIVHLYSMMKKANLDLESVIEKRTVELRVANEKLHELSMKDPLTGLYNRRYFQEQFTLTAKIQARSNQFLSILIIDVDFFKQFNDLYGHVEGDRCLQKIAETIYSSLPRKSDFCARYGGEEFIVCLPGTDGKGACFVAERMRSNVLSQGIPHVKSSIVSVVTVSIGVCDTSDSQAQSLIQLIQNADEALYRAKHSGRNQVCLFSVSKQNDTENQ